MSIFIYTADQLFDWLLHKEEMLFLDVRNATDFARFKVESPYPFELLNISYFDFMEIEDQCIARLPKDKPIRIICAKEGSAKYVAEIIDKNGFKDVGYLQGGIKSWGNLLVPKLLTQGKPYELYQFIRPGKASCSYGLHCDGELVLFDPSRNTSFYTNFAKKLQAKISATCETHLQADYIAGSRMLMESEKAVFYANSSDFTGAKFPYTALTHQQNLPLFKNSSVSVQAFFTPGHTPGSTSFVIDNTYLISGDAVFLQSIGRPDLGGMVDEWSSILFTTLQMIKELPHSLNILPGHYIDWKEANADLQFMATLEQAIAHNRAIYEISSPELFLQFIKANMREQPPEYATIRKINAHIEQVSDEEAEVLDLGKNECAASAYAAKQKK